MGRADLDFTAELDTTLTLIQPLVLEFFFPQFSTHLPGHVHSPLPATFHFSHNFSGSQRLPSSCAMTCLRSSRSNSTSTLKLSMWSFFQNLFLFKSLSSVMGHSNHTASQPEIRHHQWNLSHSPSSVQLKHLCKSIHFSQFQHNGSTPGHHHLAPVTLWAAPPAHTQTHLASSNQLPIKDLDAIF